MKQDEANLIALKNLPIKTTSIVSPLPQANVSTSVNCGGGSSSSSVVSTTSIQTIPNAVSILDLKMLEDEKQMVGGCCVCADDSGYSDNQLVYCDGHECLVAVHQGCYGIITVPDGNWYCKVCEFKMATAKESLEEKISCQLCPSKEGAFKRTDTGKWAHVVCALYIPEITFGNNRTMEPIITSLTRAERYNKKCSICELNESENNALTNLSHELSIAAANSNGPTTSAISSSSSNSSNDASNATTSNGVYVNCGKSGCKHWYHVTCAQMVGLLCENISKNSNTPYSIYCKYHYSKLSNTDVKRIPGFKLSAILSSSNEPENISTTVNTTSKAKKNLKRKSLTTDSPSSSSPSLTTTPATLLLCKENDSNLDSNLSKKGKKPRLSISTTTANAKSVEKLTSPKTTSLSLRNSNTSISTNNTTTSVSLASKTRQSSVESKSEKEEKNAKLKKTTTTIEITKDQNYSNQHQNTAKLQQPTPKNSENTTKSSLNQKQINKPPTLNDKQLNSAANTKSKQEHKASLSLDLVANSSEKLFHQQESSSSDSGVALSLISPGDESPLFVTNNSDTLLKANENLKSDKRKSSRSNLNGGGEEKSDDVMSNVKGLHGSVNLNLITPSSSSVSSVSSVSSSCSSSNGTDALNTKSTASLNQKRSRKTNSNIGMQSIKTELNKNHTITTTYPPPLPQDQSNSNLTSNMLANNNAFDLLENVEKNPNSSLSINTHGNHLIKVPHASNINASIKDDQTSDSLTFKHPNLNKDSSRIIEHTNFKANLNADDTEVGIWPVPFLTHRTRENKVSETSHSDDDDDDADVEDKEEFPKTLESLLLKQWNLGLELFNDSSSSSKSESFEIIKLLNLLSECKKENRDLEKSLASLEKKKAHLESLNSKLAVKFTFTSLSEESNFKTENENHDMPIQTKSQSQSPISFSTVPARSSSSSVTFHNPISSTSFQPTSQPSCTTMNTSSSVANTPIKKTTQHQQLSTSSFGHSNFLMASPISSASSQSSSMNNSYAQQQLTPNLNRPQSQPHSQHQTNPLMHNNNNSTSSFLNSYLQNLNQNVSSESRSSNLNNSAQNPQNFLSLLSKSLTSSMVNNPAFANSLLNMNNNNSGATNNNVQSSSASTSNPFSSSLLQAFQSPLNYQQIAYYLAANSNHPSSSSNVDTSTSSILANLNIIKSPNK